MIRQIPLLGVLCLSLLATGCYCGPGGMCHSGYGTGARLSQFLSTPMLGHSVDECGCGSGCGEAVCTAPTCASPVMPGCAAPVQPCGHPSCAAPGCMAPTWHPGQRWAPADTSCPNCQHGTMRVPHTAPSPQPVPEPMPEPQPVPPQNNAPAEMNDASVFGTNGIRRTGWVAVQEKPIPQVNLPGRRVSHRALPATAQPLPTPQPIVPSHDELPFFEIPGQ